jgi:hypothetical protein
MNNELFTSICNGDIQNSILLSTKILFLNDSIETLEIVYIDICSYIGTFISLLEISKLIDIYSNTKLIIEQDKIVIKDIYILITKMCILCDIYNKHPRSKCGNMSILTLKNKIQPLFDNSEMKLSNNGIIRFEGVIPPYDNENYSISLKIIAIIIKTIKLTDDISVDDSDKLCEISNNIRLVIDYILRKKYKFETKFYSSDNDTTWFIWGIFSILYEDNVFNDAFFLYNYEYKKKYRTKRLGLIWSLGIIAIYIHKKDVSKSWSTKEQIVINKMDEISINLYNEIRKDIIKDNPQLSEKNNKNDVEKNDGLDFIIKYIPIVNIPIASQTTVHNKNITSDDTNPRIISY